MANDIRYYEETRFGIRTAILTVLMLLGLALFPRAVTAQQAVSEVTVVHGGSWGVACPAGYDKIGVDLNQRAGGDFIFVCYKKGVGAPITELRVSVGNPPAPLEQYGYTRIPVDLNLGAGGNFIWLWYNKDPSCSVVTDIKVVGGGSSSVSCPAGYQKYPTDLNRDAGGDFIYICQELQ